VVSSGDTGLDGTDAAGATGVGRGRVLGSASAAEGQQRKLGGVRRVKEKKAEAMKERRERRRAKVKVQGLVRATRELFALAGRDGRRQGIDAERRNF
jgi:hypothetical protein